MERMKTLLKLTGVLVLLGLLAFSCSKGQLYDGTSWYTETGPGMSITLTFSDSGQKCMFLEDLGECGLGCEYQVEWKSRNAFNLFFQEGEQVFIPYSGVINGDTMQLDYRRSDDLIRTYELKKKH